MLQCVLLLIFVWLESCNPNHNEEVEKPRRGRPLRARG